VFYRTKPLNVSRGFVSISWAYCWVRPTRPADRYRNFCRSVPGYYCLLL